MELSGQIIRAVTNLSKSDRIMLDKVKRPEGIRYPSTLPSQTSAELKAILISFELFEVCN